MLNSLGSPGSRRVYEFALVQFIAWYSGDYGFVREQFFLAAVAQNIKRLVRFLSQGQKPTLATT